MTLLLLLLLHAAPTHAQNRVGNGGDVVVCVEGKGGKIRSAQLLDFYESDHERTAGGGEHGAIVVARLEALKKKDASLGDQYLRRWESMQKEVSYREGIALTEVDDSEHVFKPADKNCAIKQIALRKTNAMPGEPRFVVNKTYWDKLPPLDRAGLLLHEIVYEHFYKLGEKNSVKARAFNARLFARKFDEESADEYWKFVSGLKVPLYRK